MCDSLETLTNTCVINKCIRQIDFLDHKSASPSLYGIVKFKRHVYYENVLLKEAFVKMYLSPKPSYDPDIPNLSDIQALSYETRVYKDIIRPLIDDNICPNFVRYLSSGQNCDPNLLAETDKLTAYLDRLEYTSEELELIGRDFTMDFLITRAVPDNAVTLRDFNFHLIPSNQKELIIFQIAAACYAMNTYNMTHNDLQNIGNIWVLPLPEPVDVTYHYNNQYYSFNDVQYKVLVYDFDRAYCYTLGDNPMFDDNYLCNNYGQCNTVHPTRDFLSMMYGLIHIKGIIELSSLIIDKNSTTYKDARKFLAHSKGYLQPNFPYNLFYSMEEILDNCAVFAGATNVPTTGINVFTCNPLTASPEQITKYQSP